MMWVILLYMPTTNPLLLMQVEVIIRPELFHHTDMNYGLPNLITTTYRLLIILGNQLAENLKQQMYRQLLTKKKLAYLVI